jgi:hypothetical protein
MTLIPRDEGERAYALAHEMALKLSTRRQARAAEISRARHLAYGVLRRLYPAVAAADVARAVGYEECEVDRAATRYVAMRCQQRKAASELRGYWHDDELEAALMRRLDGDAPREIEARIEPPLPAFRLAPRPDVTAQRTFGRRRVVVEIFGLPRVPAVSGMRE